ncbi:MAG: hypothetical protein GEV28_38765 [Actinophytocola sp.]|uniref:hypothetical protein n=1 Tax=Actinophytocola sp. TaxID=1872138 RepID=UPI001326C146|nr:hypothetical protein [Actinophytocola sp.]MPZ86000.1 hypothetical protein [Actinophytocola sp.]
MRRAVAALCGLVLLGVTGCATQGGVEVEGGASQVSPPPSAPTLPSGTPVSTDGVAVLRADPAMNAKVKSTLVPCAYGQYPVEERYADLTGDGRAELVITVLSCPAKEVRQKESGAYLSSPAFGGYAGYVYNLATDPPTRLLGVEESGLELVLNTGDGRDLTVVHSRYLPRDDPCCPTDQRLTLYRWNGAALVETTR